MQLYFAFHHSLSSDPNHPMFKKVILEDDLSYPLHADFLRDLLRETRFTISTFLEDLCHVNDTNGSPLGGRYTPSFIESFLSDLLAQYSSSPKFSQLKYFYFDRVLHELKARIDENKFNFYILVLDPDTNQHLAGERFSSSREELPQLLYDKAEPPTCFFDQTSLYHALRWRKLLTVTKESNNRYQKMRQTVFNGGKKKTFTNNYHFHIFENDSEFAIIMFSSTKKIEKDGEY